MPPLRAAAPPGGRDSGQKATLCGPPDTLTNRTVVPGVTVSTLGSNAAFLVPSPVMRTSIRGPAAAAAGAAPPDAAGALDDVCVVSGFFSPPQPRATAAIVVSGMNRIARALPSGFRWLVQRSQYIAALARCIFHPAA